MDNNKTNKGEYNPKLMSSLLRAAKGPHRTAAKFCEDCGIGVSTFSRYANELKKRPCPVDILEKIAEHAAPDSNVTLEKLLAANGDAEVIDTPNEPELTLNEMVGILTSTLLSNKCECQSPENIKPVDIMGLPYSPSWSFMTNAIDGQNLKRWDFILWKVFTDLVTEAERFIRQLLMIIAIAHLGCVNFDKLTFVFSSTALYDTVLERTRSLKLDFYLSLLLINPVSKQIQREHHITSTQQTAPLSILSADTTFSHSGNSLLSVDQNNIL